MSITDHEDKRKNSHHKQMQCNSNMKRAMRNEL